MAAQLIGPPAATPDAAAPEAAAAAPAERPRANVFGLELSTFAQLILAGIIPWLLAAAALPLETIIRNSVFIISIFASFALIFLGFISRTISAVFKNVGVFVLAIYDFIIFIPLWIERRVKASGAGAAPDAPAQPRKARKRRDDDENPDDLILEPLVEPSKQKAPQQAKSRTELEKA